jgi:hypothetical protein
MKIQLLIFSLITCLSSISAQNASKVIDTEVTFFKGCDTLILNNGTVKYVTILKTEKGYMHYKECDDDRNIPDDVLRLVAENDIEAIKRGKEQKTYIDILKRKKPFYFEAGLGLSVLKPDWSVGASAFMGYQFKSSFGLGISYISHFFVIKGLINSLNVDYRYEFDRDAFTLYYGKVVRSKFDVDEECKSSVLDKSKPNTCLGLSWRHYNLGSFYWGLNYTYLRTPVVSNCAQTQPISPTSVYKDLFFDVKSNPVSIIFGFYFTPKYQKMRRD